ncbi:MAG: DNA mismatch repair endonuclease MutL, partial [Ferruginibacter sp.]
GFVGKPETAKKTRGDQYIFVNQRFIRSPYLHHAIVKAYDALLPKDTVPMYALFIELDPARLDINVHPTKQEIKFEDDKIVYAFVQSAVKHALAQFSITPTLDFELDPSIQQLDAVQRPASDMQQDMTAHSSLYQTFRQKNQAHMIDRPADLKHWKSLYEQTDGLPDQHEIRSTPLFDNQPATPKPLAQLHQTYILTETTGGFRLIHQQRAHERILYERYLLAMEGRPVATQQSLFPATIELSTSDAVLMHALLDDLRELGYQLEPFGKTTFIVQGTPADVDIGSEKEAIESILEQFKNVSAALKLESREKIVRVLSVQHALKTGMVLSLNEMESMINALFTCSQPMVSPSGKPIVTDYVLPASGQ